MTSKKKIDKWIQSLKKVISEQPEDVGVWFSQTGTLTLKIAKLDSKGKWQGKKDRYNCVMSYECLEKIIKNVYWSGLSEFSAD